MDHEREQFTNFPLSKTIPYLQARLEEYNNLMQAPILRSTIFFNAHQISDMQFKNFYFFQMFFICVH
jgi:hypothetical protein